MDILTLILIPFLVGIFTNRVDDILVRPTLENIFKSLKQDDKQVNQELEKALRLCFLSAQQTIARESHKELIGSSVVQRYRGIIVYPPEHRYELQWLDQKLKQLVKQIKQVKRSEYVEIPLKSLDEIASLLTPEGQLLVRENLIAEALKDDSVPECYAAKIKAVLFEQVRDNFAAEIKHNSVVRDIVNVKLLANINANLAKQQLKIQDLEKSVRPSEARRKVKLEFDVEKLDAARLDAIVQHLQTLLDDGSIKLRRIEEGCMELYFDGSQKGLEKLDALFKSGELKEILGITVQDVRGVDADVSLSEVVVNLSEWLQNVFDAGWQTVEEVLGVERGNLVFATRGISISESVIRAKQIDLETQPNSQFINLVVDVIPKANQQLGIVLQVHPISTQIYLPQGLNFSVIDTSGKVVLESKARHVDNFIQLEIGVEVGDQFTVKITLGDASVIQNFAV